MFTHQEVWDGIDKLAKSRGWSASRLAREAGLDPTTFNKSKRHTNEAKPRWPSTESLAKILEATKTPFDQFVAMMAGRPTDTLAAAATQISCIGLDEAGDDRLFDEAGFPIGTAWDEIDFPGFGNKQVYALEVRGDAMAPIYRDGDFLIMSPEADVRRHDRVMAKMKAGAVEIGTLQRRTAQRIEIQRLDPGQSMLSLPIRDVRWMSRIVWVSQ